MSDYMIFDDDDEVEAVAEADRWARKLIVPARAETSEQLNQWEEQYRREGRPPVIFEDDDGTIWDAAAGVWRRT